MALDVQAVERFITFHEPANMGTYVSSNTLQQLSEKSIARTSRTSLCHHCSIILWRCSHREPFEMICEELARDLITLLAAALTLLNTQLQFRLNKQQIIGLACQRNAEKRYVVCTPYTTQLDGLACYEPDQPGTLCDIYAWRKHTSLV